jgi:2-polyprenyl-3-methyl-5-hydroxy-6-metoxy-1,4-benzoquinol methylase
MSDSTTSHIRYYRLKNFMRRSMGFMKLNLTYPVNPGVSMFGVNVFRDQRPGPPKPRSQYALEYAMKLRPPSVLDVGSGGGEHALAFQEAGARVLCVDYGTSHYAQASTIDGLEVVKADFNRLQMEERFHLVWASHILEHQRNVGAFIEKLVEFCAEGGMVAITVPDPHRNLWSGHLTLWTPGLLAYNAILCGLDLSDAKFVRGTGEFSIFFRPKRVPLPDDLTYDFGDLRKLQAYLPKRLYEDADPWAVDYERP